MSEFQRDPNGECNENERAPGPPPTNPQKRALAGFDVFLFIFNSVQCGFF